MEQCINRVEIENFLCFKSAVVDLRRFNVLVGENGAGKSAFIEALAFAADVEKFGLRNALHRYGGIEALRRRDAPDGTTLRVTVHGRNYRDLRILDVDVHAARRPALKHSEGPLLTHASNLAAVLDCMSPDTFKAIEKDMAGVFPNFEGIEIADDEETVTIRRPTSSGMVRALAIFTFLHEQHHVACIEGIERDIHPAALERIVERLREARTQFIVTSQWPLENADVVVRFDRSLGVAAHIEVCAHSRNRSGSARDGG